MTALVLDVGSSSVRALLWDTDTLHPIEGGEAKLPYTFDHDVTGASTIDAGWLRRRVEGCINAVLSHEAAQTITVVAMTTFAGNLVGVDGQNRPVTPLYTYADTRATATLDTLRDRLDVDAAYQRTRARLHSAYHPARLHWLHATQPDTANDVAVWLDFATYCYRVWFSGGVPMSYSLASWSGLLNRHDLSWDAGWLAALDLPPSRLPGLADIDATQQGLNPEYRDRWPRLANVPFTLAVGDGAAANIGSGATNTTRLALTVGTTAAVRQIVVTAPDPLPDGLWDYRVTATRHLVGGATSEGGGVYQWACKTFGLDAGDVEILLQRCVADAHGLTVIPTLDGERSPGYTAQTATFHGVRRATKPMDMLQALLESVAMRLATIADQLDTHRDPVFAGGGALVASPAWAQIMADALNRPIYLLSEREVTARGAAILALGRLDDTPDPVIAQTIEPRPAAVDALAAARERQHDLYRRLYRS